MFEISGTRETRIRGEMAGIRSEAGLQKSLLNACLVAQVCEDFRGQDVQVLDVTNATSLFDFFVIATGSNRRQLRAMAEKSDDMMNAQRSNRLGREGADVPWICHDYGDIVLHVFVPDARKLYDLENLWGDAVRVDWKSMIPESMRPTARPIAPKIEEIDLDVIEDDEQSIMDQLEDEERLLREDEARLLAELDDDEINCDPLIEDDLDDEEDLV
ncbi:ribosome silencing factor [Planctomicrobium sp. SH668]|uniref:ribosome silencing factor n=1 Tax=Planctomicrobium sp. SH668 TaxID=3448126 RepID=UPI003F5BF65E